MDSPSFLLLCLEQGNCSLEAHLTQFLNLAHQSNFPNNCVCTFLVALKALPKAQLSRKGPQGGCTAFLKWVLASCGSSFTVDTSPTPNPVPSQEPPDSEEWQHEPTADRVHLYCNAGVRDQPNDDCNVRNIASDLELSESDQLCEPAASTITTGVCDKCEGVEWNPAHTPVTESEFLACTMNCYFNFE